MLWEIDVGAVGEEGSYKLVGVGACSFNSVKFLSVGANCVIESVSDIGEVAELESDGEFEEGACAIVKRVVVGEADGVLCAEEYLSCFSCNAKVKEVNEVVSRGADLVLRRRQAGFLGAKGLFFGASA